VTLFVFTRPCVHIYFIIYHIRGAHIYLVLLGCFNPFTAMVRIVPKQFTLNAGIFLQHLKKYVLVYLLHCRRNSLSPVLSIITSYSQSNCASHLKFSSLMVRAAPKIW